MAEGDTNELRRIYDSIEAHHQQLMSRYQHMAGGMDADLQQMYDNMERMHGSAVQMHREMMEESGHGMMGREMQGSGMMGSGTMVRSQTREWDRQMLAMHQQMSQYSRGNGYDEMAAMHDRMAHYYAEAAEAQSDVANQPPPSPEGEISGQSVYQQSCATCHGTSGGGMATAFPSLAGSDWVTGDPETLIRIVLHGLQGEIEVRGQFYSGTMPAFGARLSDEEIAAALSYVRISWGNDASEIGTDQVRSIREEYGNREEPWTADGIR